MSLPRLASRALLMAAAVVAFAGPLQGAERIPALADVPGDLPVDVRAALSQERGTLGAEYRAFRADSDAFNALPAKQQEDGVFNQLIQRRQAYLERAKAFNARVLQVHDNFVAAKAPRAGVAAAVRGECWYTLPGGTRVALTSGDPIPAGSIARVETGPTGRIQLLLADQTTFTIGPRSDVVIDDFVYDPSTSLAKTSAQIAKGFFRYVTGKVGHALPNNLHPDNLNVHCAVGDLGIRGTDFEADVAEDGTLTVRLFSGEVDFTPKGGGAAVVIKGRQRLRFGPTDAAAQASPLPDTVQPSL